jgi:hypothetical protein
VIGGRAASRRDRRSLLIDATGEPVSTRGRQRHRRLLGAETGPVAGWFIVGLQLSKRSFSSR